MTAPGFTRNDRTPLGQTRRGLHFATEFHRSCNHAVVTHSKAKANAPSAPDGTVIASTIGQVVASKDPARAIVYQAGGNIYRYVQGAFIADATKPSNYF